MISSSTDFGGRTTLIVGLAENTDEGSLVFVINGALDRFEPSTIKRLAHDFSEILRSVSAADQPF